MALPQAIKERAHRPLKASQLQAFTISSPSSPSSSTRLFSAISCAQPFIAAPLVKTSSSFAAQLTKQLTLLHTDFENNFSFGNADFWAELEHRLVNEKPMNHLDMRHRLDSRGQREGKVIDYKVSDLRVDKLLGDLCSSMKSYSIGKEGPEKGKWIKLDDSNVSISESDKQEAEVHSKHMSTYCGRLLADFEDELEKKIKKGLMIAGQVEQTLCWELSNHCVSKIDAAEENEDILERSYGEL